MPLDKVKAPFTLAKLPYAENALEPVISSKTISFHYGKHHAAYVAKLNELVAGTDYEQMSLEDIVKKSAKSEKDKAIFNNAGQVWNHDFYWHSMNPKGGEPSGKIKDAIQSSFGGLKEFKEAFAKAAVAQFGSGWAWLIKGKDGKLAIKTTSNADTPLAHGETALLTADVWEHAYYLDYQNKRPDHVNAWLDKLANWSFAEKNL
jgi:Fe-Mn family superoxide dismutase